MDDDFRGVDQVKILTSALISKLKENRDSHAQLFKDAMEGYFVETKKKLEKKLKELDNKTVIASFKVEVPKDHTKEYDRLIAMLEMSQDTELVISSHDFNRYVLDEWISADEKGMLVAMAMSSSNSGAYL